MAENVEILMLEHLKRFRATLEHVATMMDDIIVRVGSLGFSVAWVMQHPANLSAADVVQQLSINNVDRRLELAS